MLAAATIGAVLGFLASVPVAGPIAALVLARALDGRFRSGRLIAAGAGAAEGVYAFLAFYGFGALLSDYPWITPASRGGAAIILTIVAVLLLRKSAVAAPLAGKAEVRATPFGSFALGFGISIANPTLLATWTAAMTFVYGSGLVEFSSGSAVAFALGTVVGTIGWFVLFLAVLHRVRRRFSRGSLVAVRRMAALLVLGLAVWFAVRFVQAIA